MTIDCANKSIEQRIVDAAKYRKSEQLGKALFELNAILEKNPHFFFAAQMKAEIYFIQERFESSLKWFLLCDDILERAQNPQQQHSMVLYMIAKIYRELDDIEHALVYTKKALEKFKIYNEYKEGTSYQLPIEHKIQLMWDLTELYFLKKEYDTALEYCYLLLNIFRRREDKETMNEIIMEIAYIYETQQRYEKAIEFYTKVLHSFEEQEKPHGRLGLLHYYLGRIYYLIELFPDAYHHLETALYNFEKESLARPSLALEEEGFYWETKSLWNELRKNGYSS